MGMTQLGMAVLLFIRDIPKFIELALAVVSLAREFLDYLNKHPMKNKECAINLKEVTNAFIKAKKTKDTSYIEHAFSNFSTKLSDSEKR